MTPDDIYRVFLGSDAAKTRALYDEMEAIGAAGRIAVELMRAQKASTRAKQYRGSRFRAAAYERKGWALEGLCDVLRDHADAYAIVWGWGVDEAQPYHRHVLYVALSTGQVSFHAPERGHGPDFLGAWDGVRNVSTDRILRFARRVFAASLRDCGATT